MVDGGTKGEAEVRVPVKAVDLVGEAVMWMGARGFGVVGRYSGVDGRDHLSTVKTTGTVRARTTS